ncbi:MAG: hypothetical protein KDI36_14405 [Pseudomonadales bacterium]|nr:hypothetical protein [Pseudomonadales bacterium]
MSDQGDEDLNKWDRYFAIEANNLAWQLTTQPRTAAEDDELLNLAHSSAFHWSRVGNELNRMRATMLLAEVHALLGLGQTALLYAGKMRDFFLAQDDVPDWETAFVHTIHAHAACAAADHVSHQVSYELARKAIDAIADEDDRNVVLQTFNAVPVPGDQTG